MRVAFPIRFTQEEHGGYVVQGLAPLTGVITEGDDLEEAKAMAVEALSGVLASRLDHNETIPRPGEAQGEDIIWIEPEPDVAAPILFRWAREDAKLTQSELASRINQTWQSVQRLERPGANPSLKTLNKVAKALGKRVTIAL